MLFFTSKKLNYLII